MSTMLGRMFRPRQPDGNALTTALARHRAAVAEDAAAAISEIPRKRCAHNSAGTPRPSCPDCARSAALDEAEAAARNAGGQP
jgi:hypothetical protein